MAKIASRPIPEIRDELFKLAVDWDKPYLAVLADAMRRRHCATVHARPRQKPITREVCEQVRAFKAQHLGMGQRAVGAYFGIDQGRVHEILYGFNDGKTYEEKHNL